MKKMLYIAAVSLLYFTANASLFTDDFNRADTSLNTNPSVSIGSGYVLTQLAGDKLAQVRVLSNQLAWGQTTAGSANAQNILLYQTSIALQNTWTVQADIQTGTGASGTLLYGLAFNVQPDGSFYAARITTGTNGVSLQMSRYAAGGSVTGFATPTTSSVSNSTPLALSSVYHLAVSSSVPGVVSYLLTGPGLDGGQLSGAMTDTTLKLSGGYAGFYTTAANNGIRADNLSIETIPEPATVGLLGFSTVVILLIRRMRSK